eukprot:scaffold12073_cov108-Isochrysis_galbana.AAC.1
MHPPLSLQGGPPLRTPHRSPARHRAARPRGGGRLPLRRSLCQGGAQAGPHRQEQGPAHHPHRGDAGDSQASHHGRHGEGDRGWEMFTSRTMVDCEDAWVEYRETGGGICSHPAPRSTVKIHGWVGRVTSLPLFSFRAVHGMDPTCRPPAYIS